MITGVEWGFIALAAIFFGPSVVFLLLAALTGKKPSAAEVARAQQMAATPAHPALRHPGLPVDGRPLDEDEQRRLDEVQQDATYAPAPRRDQ